MSRANAKRPDNQLSFDQLAFDMNSDAPSIGENKTQQEGVPDEGVSGTNAPPENILPEESAEPEKLISELLQETKTEPAPLPPQKRKVGEVLRDARLAADFALDDIAAEIKIKPHHLLAIEESRYNDLPSRTHAFGFVKAYAQILNQDVDALVAECRRELSAQHHYKPAPLMMPEPVMDSPMPSSSLVITTAALAFLLSAVGYVFMRPPLETAQVTAPPPALIQKAPEQKITEIKPAPVVVQPPPPVVAAPAPVVQAAPAVQAAAPVQTAPPQEEPAQVDTADVDTTHVSSGFLKNGLIAQTPVVTNPADKTAVEKTPAAPSRIKLKAVQETTVQIFDGTGRMIAERVINKGEAFYLPDKSGYTLATANAGALHMQIDGREMQPLGDPDEAMHNIPLNPDSLLKYLQ